MVFALGIFTSITFSSLGHILLLLSGLYYFALASKNKEPFNLPYSAYALLLFVLVIFISVLVNLDSITKPWGNISKAKYFIIPLLGVFALRKIKLSEKQIKTLLWSFILATSLASLAGIIAYYSGFNPLKMKPGCHPDRSCGMYGMYMTYGYGISLFQILLTGLVIYYKEIERFIPRWFLYSAWVVNGLGLYLSMTRGGWIGFLVALPLFYLKTKKKIMFILTAFALISGSIAYLSVPSFKNLFQMRIGSDDQRISFYKAAYAAFQEKPLLGYGHRNFEPNSKDIKIRHGISHAFYGGHAHNNYLEALASTGFLGALFFILFLALGQISLENTCL